MTILKPGIAGIIIGPILKPASTGRKYSREKLNKKAAITVPVILPKPPSTTTINILKVIMNINALGSMVVIRQANNPPATPAKKALTANDITL